jgi:hypothetical protein
VLATAAANPNRSLGDISNTLGKAEAGRMSPLNWFRKRLTRPV